MKIENSKNNLKMKNVVEVDFVFAQKGITLVALIITIILMLILSGVVISLTIGENGLFNTAKYAAKKWQNAEKEEISELDKLNKLTYGITSFESMLEACNIDKKYTLEDLVNNKDGILEKVLANNNAVDYILSNPKEYLEAFVNSEIAVTMLAQKENTKGKVINNLEWLNKIQSSNNVESFDKNMEVIPIMTSNNTPSGEVIASAYSDQNHPYCAFDGNTDSYFYNNTANNDYTITYKFDNIKNIYKISVNLSNPSSLDSNNKFIIYISEDEEGEEWEEVKNDTWKWAKGENGAKRTETITLKKVKQVRRIKIYSYIDPSPVTVKPVTHIIYKIQAYGI